MSFHVPEDLRVTTGERGTDASYGNNGMFLIKSSMTRKRPQFCIIASDGEGWEHVSVSTTTRCPTWEEMAAIKAMFWDGEDCVVQFHPPESEYVNNHPYCLHLWRATDAQFPMPSSLLVGYKFITTQATK